MLELLRKIGMLALILIVGGIFLQTIGYIDSPFFAWFTDMELFIE